MTNFWAAILYDCSSITQSPSARCRKQLHAPPVNSHSRPLTVLSVLLLQLTTFCSFVDHAPFHSEAYAITPGVFSAFYPHRSHLPLNLTRVRPPLFLSRSIMAAAHPDDTNGTEPTPSMNTGHQPGSTHTPQSTAPHNLHTQPTQTFLPGNGPTRPAPSFTHQPELLFLHRLFDILFVLVTHILEHPMAHGSIPDPTMFVDDNAFRLFHQYHSSIVDPGRATMRLKRARRLLQFVPGPPGLPGQYRLDPTAHFLPNTIDFLAPSPTTPPQSPARSHSPSSFPLSTITISPPENAHAHGSATAL